MSNLAGMNLALSRLHSNAKPEYVFDENYLIETVTGLVTIKELIEFWNEEHSKVQTKKTTKKTTTTTRKKKES